MVICRAATLTGSRVDRQPGALLLPKIIVRRTTRAAQQKRDFWWIDEQYDVTFVHLRLTTRPRRPRRRPSLGGNAITRQVGGQGASPLTVEVEANPYFICT